MQTSDVRLIVDLADAVRGAGPIQKDAEAARLIDQLIGTQPDALYFLVQTVLLQKEALAAAAAPAGTTPPAAPAAAAPAAAEETPRGRWEASSAPGVTAERTSRHPPVAVAVAASCAPLPPGRRRRGRCAARTGHLQHVHLPRRTRTVCRQRLRRR
jgi:hypothetical protein